MPSMPGTMFELLFTEKADLQLDALEKAKGKKIVLKAVRKTLGLMEVNLRHPSLRTHEYSGLEGGNGEKVFESYAQTELQEPIAYSGITAHIKDR